MDDLRNALTTTTSPHFHMLWGGRDGHPQQEMKTMVAKAETVWFDGELVNWEDANVHVLTHTLHYGLGVFEGIRVYEREDGQSAVFRLREHIERFARWCARQPDQPSPLPASTV